MSDTKKDPHAERTEQLRLHFHNQLEYVRNIQADVVTGDLSTAQKYLTTLERHIDAHENPGRPGPLQRLRNTITDRHTQG